MLLGSAIFAPKSSDLSEIRWDFVLDASAIVRE
jgi:hypothetical protein